MAKEVIELFEDRVIIRQLDGEKKTPGGIIIPDTANEKPCKGIIVDCGKMENNLKVGDKVLFGKYAGSEITLNGEELMVMREKDVMGLIREVEELPANYQK